MTADRDALDAALRNCRAFVAGTVFGVPADAYEAYLEHLADAVLPLLDAARAEGAARAVEYLRAGYPYGTGPDWREQGAEWIQNCFANEAGQS